MRKHKSCSIAIIVVVLLLASLVTACASSAPSSAPPTEMPSTTESPQQGQPAEEGAAEEPTPPAAKLALFVIYNQFHETEYGEPRAVLEDAGVIVTVASSSLDAVTGHSGMQVEPDVVLGDVYAADYDAIVFVGGYGYDQDGPEACRVAQEAAAEGKVLAAICIAPITLAKAGVLDGKRATSSVLRSELEAEGAIWTGATVERDGLIITANGPAAARRFGETIVAALEE